MCVYGGAKYHNYKYDLKIGILLKNICTELILFIKILIYVVGTSTAHPILKTFSF